MKHLSGPDDPKLMWSVTKAFLLVLGSAILGVMSAWYVAINVI